MALQGAGDPRWVVRERQDGRNVNGWHWEDKDVTAWAKHRLKTLLSSEICKATCSDGSVHVETVSTIEGDATLYNRKGILKVLYDLKISGTWITSPLSAKGTFKFELFDEEPDIQTAADAKSPPNQQLKSLFSNSVAPIIRSQCRIFIAELHGGAGQALDGVSVESRPKEEESKVTDYLRSGMGQSEQSKGSDVQDLSMSDVFTCSVGDLFLALTERARMEATLRGRVISEGVVGGRYDLLDGAVIGKYIKVSADEPEEIVLEWKMREWGDAEAGIAVLKMGYDDGKTELTVTVRGVPKDQTSCTEGFWRARVMQGVKIVMGWGNASRFL